MKKSKKGKKGEYGYIRAEKRRRFFVTLGLFAIPLLIFFTALLYFGTEKNVLTIVALVGCLPACKSMVGLIMMMIQRPMDQALYEQIAPHQGKLQMTYETLITTYEKNSFVDCFAICGNQVVGYTDRTDVDLDFVAKHVQKILHHNGFKVTVMMVPKVGSYVDRLDSLNEHFDSLHADIPFTPNEQYPDLSRDELIKHTILAIAL